MIMAIMMRIMEIIISHTTTLIIAFGMLLTFVTRLIVIRITIAKQRPIMLRIMA